MSDEPVLSRKLTPLQALEKARLALASITMETHPVATRTLSEEQLRELVKQVHNEAAAAYAQTYLYANERKDDDQTTVNNPHANEH